ncbi:MAG: glycosyltransferase family 39 protein [Dehalococcoidia bacterium]
MEEAGRAIAQDTDSPTARPFGDPAWWGRWAVPVAVGLALAGGLSIRLLVAWQGLEELVVKLLQDDSFYYFLTAERITDGQGISFDGITASNGYHPLWLFFLVPFFLLPGRDLPIHAALSGAAVLDVVAGALVALTVRKLTGNTPAALFALIFYLFLPRNVLSGVNGLETSATTPLVAALLLVVVSVWRAPRDDWMRWSVLTGALAGLTMLARLDSGVVVVCLLGLIALQQRGARRWQAPGIALGVAAVVVAPWFLWSLIAVGTWIPVSGEAGAWFSKEHYYASHPGISLSDEIRQGLDVTEFVFRERIPDLYYPRSWLSRAIAVGAGVLALHFALVASPDLRRKAVGWLAFVAVPLAGFVALLLVHTLYRWFFREWYFAWGMPILALLAAVLFAYLAEGVSELSAKLAPRWRAAAPYAVLVAVVLVLAAGYLGPAREAWRAGYLAPQRDFLEAGLYLKAHTEPDTRSASFAAGIVGYFSERQVVNIDGVVNPKAYDALRDHRLVAYLRSEDVRFVAARDPAWVFIPAFIRPDDWSQSLWGEDPNAAMVPVAKIGPPFGVFGQMTVFRMLR